MKKFKLLLALIFLSMLLVATACKEDELITPPVSEITTIENIVIKNNAAELTRRLSRRNVVVEMIPEYLPENNLKSTAEVKDLRSNFVFKLKAEVDPPEHEGRTLMATHVFIDEHFAFVTYNIRGEEFGGALEIFDVRDLDNPQILSQVIFPESDINSVHYDKGKVYLVGATSNVEELGFKDPASFKVLSVNPNMQILSLDTIIDVPSFSANGIYVSKDRIYITSGDTGGLTILDKDYKLVRSESIPDARSVTANDDFVYVLSGQPGTLSVFNKTNSQFLNTTQIGGANTPHSKSEISATDEYLFAALNEEGLRMVNLNTTPRTIRQQIPRPETPPGDIDANHVTNSVSFNHPLLFIGNGHSGVSVGELVSKQNDQIVLKGQMVFEDKTSTNFVQSRGNVVFVASGLGGLKILSISIDEGVPPDVKPTEPCPTLLTAIRNMFPESQNARNNWPKLFKEDVTLNVTTAEETNVYVTFVWEDAGWRNSFGYYAYPANDPPRNIQELKRHMVFPNVSGVGEGGGLEPGDLVQLGKGPFPANTVIGFFLVAQGWANGQIVKGIYTHYTNINFNPNKNQQHLLFIESGCQDLVLTFEDIQLPGGDRDFNDIILVIKDNPNELPNTRFNTENIIRLN
ncbi:MAG TPA: DUF4114 domain-containing protein [Bacteroidales bacterium]|nr:DUF4114 domain-containing protein [Bacteroidales bacterium]